MVDDIMGERVLPTGIEMEAELGHLESLDKMWISVKHDDCDEFAFNEQIQASMTREEGKLETVPTEDVQIDKRYIARFSLDDYLYRAQVLQVDEADIRVRFIDYGNEDTVKEVYTLNEELSKIPASAHLVHFNPGLDQTPENMAMIDAKLTSGGRLKVVLEKRDEVWAEIFLDDEKLTVELPSEIPDLNDNSQIMSEIVSAKPLSVPLKGKLPPKKSYFPELAEEDELEVEVCHYEGVDKVWVNIQTELEDLYNLQQQLQEYGDQPTLVNCKVGDLALARFSEDEELYRAKVITMDAINATVRYIDFGNVEMKPLAEVLILPEQFHSLPPFSVMINIAGLEDCPRTEENQQKLEELVSEGTVRILRLSSNSAQVSVDNVVIDSKAFTSADSTAAATPYLAEPVQCAQVSADEPVQCAQVSGIEPLKCAQVSFDEPVQCAQVSADEPVQCAQVSAVEPVTCAQVSADEQVLCAQVSADEPVQSAQVSADEPVQCAQVSADEQGGASTTITRALRENEEFAVEIGHCEEVDEVWVTLEEWFDQLDSLQERLQVLGDDQLAALTPCKIGDQAMARFSEDDALYRAKIIDIDATYATVRYIDFGNSERKPLAEVLILPEEFHSLPAFSVKMNIAGLENCARTEENLMKLDEMTRDAKIRMSSVRTSSNFTTAQFTVNDTRIEPGMFTNAAAPQVEENTAEVEVSIVAGEGLVADLGEDSLPPVPELITGQDYNVEVNHCDSVHQVWVTPEAWMLDINSLHEKLQSLGDQPVLPACKAGDLALARFTGDQELYRAEILDVKKDSGATLRYLDFGNCELKPLVEVMVLPAEFRKQPPHSVQIILTDFQKLEPTEENRSKLDALIQTGSVQITMLSNASAVISVDSKSIDPAVFTSSLAEKDIPELEMAESGTTTVTFGHLDSVNDVWLIPDLVQDSLDSLMGDIAGRVPDLQPLLEPAVGNVAIARYTDSEYYRCRVVEVKEDRVLVNFVDYGNKDWVDALLDIPPELCTVPASAVNFSLSKIDLEDTAENAEKLREVLLDAGCWTIKYKASKGRFKCRLDENVISQLSAALPPATACQPAAEQGDTATRAKDHGSKVAVDSSPEEVAPTEPLPVEVVEQVPQVGGRTSKDGAEKDQDSTASLVSEQSSSERTTEKCDLQGSNDLPVGRVQSVLLDVVPITKERADQDVILNKICGKATNKESAGDPQGSKDQSSNSSEEHTSASKVSAGESEVSVAVGKETGAIPKRPIIQIKAVSKNVDGSVNHEKPHTRKIQPTSSVKQEPVNVTPDEQADHEVSGVDMAASCQFRVGDRAIGYWEKARKWRMALIIRVEQDTVWLACIDDPSIENIRVARSSLKNANMPLEALNLVESQITGCSGEPKAKAPAIKLSSTVKSFVPSNLGVRFDKNLTAAAAGDSSGQPTSQRESSRFSFVQPVTVATNQVPEFVPVAARGRPGLNHLSPGEPVTPTLPHQQSFGHRQPQSPAMESSEMRQIKDMLETVAGATTLQEMLLSASPQQFKLRRILLSMVLSEPVRYINSPRATYVVQALIDVLDKAELYKLVNVVKQNFLTVSLHASGTFVVQKLLTIPDPRIMQELSKGIQNIRNIPDFLTNHMGTYVAQACLNAEMDKETMSHIVSSVLSCYTMVCNNQNSTFFMQKLIPYMTERGMADVNLLVKATLQHIHELAFNPNGTRVTQLVVSNAQDGHLKIAAKWLLTNLRVIYNNREASFAAVAILEELFARTAASEELSEILKNIIQFSLANSIKGRPLFICAGVDPFGYKISVTICSLTRGPMREELVEMSMRFFTELENSPHGVKVIKAMKDNVVSPNTFRQRRQASLSPAAISPSKWLDY